MVLATFAGLNVSMKTADFALSEQAEDVVKAMLPEGADVQLFGVFFGGKQIPASTPLSDVTGLKESSRVFVLQTNPTPTFHRTAASSMDVEVARDSLHSLVENHKTLRKLLNDVADWNFLDDLCESVPGLREDRWALAMLRDVDVLLAWFEEANNTILAQKPVLIDATMQMCARVRVAVKASRVAEQQAQSGQQQTSSAASNAPTPQQAITREMLMAAMGQAIARPPPAPIEDFSRQLGQLNDMGFTDRNENLTALRATGGNFEQTLEFIIARRESM